MDKNNLMNKYLLLFIPILFIVSGLKSQNAETSLDFDGANDYVNCGANSAFQVTNLTVEAWINADAWRTNNWQGTILSTDSWSGTGGQRGWVLRTGDNGRLTLLIANGSTGAWMECMSAQIMSTGKWYHVAGTYDGQTQKVYINGTLVQSYTNTGGIRYTTNDNMMIGDCTGQVGNRVFDGKIDEVRLWSAALDSTTLKKWMYKDLDTTHSQYSNLVAYYKLDEGTGTTTNDSSTNSNTGTLTNFGTTPMGSLLRPIDIHPHELQPRCSSHLARSVQFKLLHHESIRCHEREYLYSLWPQQQPPFLQHIRQARYHTEAPFKVMAAGERRHPHR
jgi:hypothetical protein